MDYNMINRFPLQDHYFNQKLIELLLSLFLMMARIPPLVKYITIITNVNKLELWNYNEKLIMPLRQNSSKVQYDIFRNRVNLDSSNTHMYDLSLGWLATGT